MIRASDRPARGATLRLAARLALLCWLGSHLGTVRAEGEWDGRVLSFTWENDAIASSDRHYTQGARIHYLAKDDAMPRWMERWLSHVPTLGYEVGAQKLGAELGQEIYTPANLRATEVVEDDRPYAGWLYGSFIAQRRGSGRTRPLIETLRLDLGVVGPESLAEQAQKKWHSQDPRGWDNQLETEPGINLRYDRRYLFSTRREGEVLGADFIPYTANSLGNVSTFLGLGGLARFGCNVPNEFGVKRAPGAPGFGAYLFAGMEGRLVLHNIFLDGNTFKESHRVDKEPWVADLKCGLALVLKWVELSASYVYRTKEFEGQDTADSLGSAIMTFRF